MLFGFRMLSAGLDSSSVFHADGGYFGHLWHLRPFAMFWLLCSGCYVLAVEYGPYGPCMCSWCIDQPPRHPALKKEWRCFLNASCWKPPSCCKPVPCTRPFFLLARDSLAKVRGFYLADHERGHWLGVSFFGAL